MSAELLHLLVTANSAGDLDYFPRLYRALRDLRGRLGGAVWLIDTGGAWSADEWLCVATENRAAYLILDAMGYTLAFADGLTVANFEKLSGQVLMQLQPADQIAQMTHAEKVLYLGLGGETELLNLPQPPKGRIQQLDIDPLSGALIGQTAHDMPLETLPDATIAATLEFISSEARYYQKQQQKP